MRWARVFLGVLVLVSLVFLFLAVRGEQNHPPVADAGSDPTVAVGALVILDGLASHDPDGERLSFQWTQTTGPGITLSDPTAIRPTFTPTVTGTYTFHLVVNDGTVDSTPARVDVVVQEEHDHQVTFSDRNLEWKIRRAINKETGPLFRADLIHLTRLELRRAGITDLMGIQYLSSLTWLDLGNNWITDLTPLLGLTNLTVLALEGNRIADITPLSELTNLTRLNLSGNQITDLAPLSELTNLTVLQLSGNRISVLSPLSGLTNLTVLELGDNLISDLARSPG
ncbi:MAG: leucine-rich repeat domain-containing protein [Dehalococcoidia bacterium]